MELVNYRAIDWIEGLPGDRYRVGDDGSVWRQTNGPEGCRRMKLQPRRGGTPTIGLTFAGKQRFFTIASLVLRAFIGPGPIGGSPKHYPDPNLSNNCLTNLIWVPWNTRRFRKGHRFGFRRGSAHPRSILQEHDIPVIRRLRAEGWTLASLAGRYGVSVRTISGAVTGKNWGWVGDPDPGPPVASLASSQH